MPEVSIESLDELLRSLARERGLRGKLRVIARAWTLLRSLSVSEREQVAMRLGSKWAWRRIERAFLKDGELSEREALVGRAFERLGRAEPEELRSLANAITTGDTADAQDLLTTALGEALEEEAKEGARVEVGVFEEMEETSAPIAPPVAAPAELVAAPVEVLASAMAHPVARPPNAPPPRAESEAPIVPLNAIFADVAARSGRQALEVLRVLRETPEEVGRAGGSTRAALVTSLGGGWASRRAVSHMIEKRSLDDLDEALRLIAGLTRPGQQIWCLGDLLEHWDLEAADVERILERAPSAAARRRLAHRSASA